MEREQFTTQGGSFSSGACCHSGVTDWSKSVNIIKRERLKYRNAKHLSVNIKVLFSKRIVYYNNKHFKSVYGKTDLSIQNLSVNAI